MQSSDSGTKRFRIALSFAGAKRIYVEQIAESLAAKFGKDAILYDNYHRSEFSRADLATYLPDLYEKESDLVVAVFCPDYENREWCGLEWNAIFGLLKNKKRKVQEVMLARFDKVEMASLRGLAGYLDLDDLSPTDATFDLLERLALNENKPRDFYKNGTFLPAPASPPPSIMSPVLAKPPTPIKRGHVALTKRTTQPNTPPPVGPSAARLLHSINPKIIDERNDTLASATESEEQHPPGPLLPSGLSLDKVRIMRWIHEHPYGVPVADPITSRKLCMQQMAKLIGRSELVLQKLLGELVAQRIIWSSMDNYAFQEYGLLQKGIDALAEIEMGDG